MIQIGHPAPECVLQRLDGTSLKLSSLCGQTIVLSFMRHLA